MKIEPRKKTEQRDQEPELTGMEQVMRRVALLAALVSIFFFFIKILFL